MQKNLQLCYSVILNVELHSSLILKTKILFYSFSLSSVSWLSHSLNFVSHVSLSFKFLLLPLLSLSDFSPSGHRWPPLPSNAKPKPCLDVLLRCGFNVLLEWVCSDVGMVCSDGDVCCLLRWVQYGFNGFAPMWMWFVLIVMSAVCSDGSWVRWWVWINGSVYHGSGGGVDLDRLWLMGLNRGNWWVSWWRFVGFWVWFDALCVDW